MLINQVFSFIIRENVVPLQPQKRNVKKSRCSAVGSVPGLGPGCRRFESCHLDISKGMKYTFIPFVFAILLFKFTLPLNFIIF